MRVLTSFATTNTPDALLRALPHYPASGESDANGASDWGDDDEDSFIAREAMCIKGGKSCWAILKGGFIQWKNLVITTPRAKGKKRRRNSYEQEEVFIGEGSESPSVVAENAWPVLIWLVGLFEKDETVTEQKGLRGSYRSICLLYLLTCLRIARHSPLLLSQIPAPRSGKHWEADAPLDVIFHCLNQTDERRRAVGPRLLASVRFLCSLYLSL